MDTTLPVNQALSKSSLPFLDESGKNHFHTDSSRNRTSAPMTNWNTGVQLGPYVLLSAIGAGGMGEVRKARDTRLDRIVAIKRLNAEKY